MHQPADAERLMREYEEAGRLFRWYEGAARRALAAFLPFAVVLLALAHGWLFAPGARAALEACGLVVSLLLVNTSLRERERYRICRERLAELESLLGLALYSMTYADRRAPAAVRFTLPYHRAAAVVGWLFAAYFLILLVRELAGLLAAA